MQKRPTGNKHQICLECQILKAENEKLRQEINRLNQLILDVHINNHAVKESISEMAEPETPNIEKSSMTSEPFEYPLAVKNQFTEQMIFKDSPIEIITKDSSLSQKIALYRSLFKGREDVFALRFESKKSGKSGYAPVCKNEWADGICAKPKMKCQDCPNKDYVALNDQIIKAHFLGNSVIGIYPILIDDHCWFLAIDFDEGDWQADIRTLRMFCDEKSIPISVERSRSGNGGHVWFFFCEPVPAAKARKFGSILVTAIMNLRHEISFKSYDRLFPSQDSLQKDGLGNLIALPLQGQAARIGNTCFVDDGFNRFSDQWLYLSQVHRLSQHEIDQLISLLAEESELGPLCDFEEEQMDKPWHKKIESSLDSSDFPANLAITLANGIYIPKHGLSQRALNRIKRLAAFSNPEFFKKQAMRFSTWDTPRIISCHQEHERYLQIPRGCQDALEQLLKNANAKWQIVDERQSGHPIEITFNGTLRPQQQEAADLLSNRQTGVLCGTTAFGKTVTAINLIARHKVNSLILVGSVPLMQQWQSSIMQFLDVQEFLPEEEKTHGRKKSRHIIGQLGGSKNDIHNVIDIVVFQSAQSGNQVKDFIKNYGLVIVDECHHAAAVSLEKVLSEVTAKYVYGLSATPVRQDGKHPIVYMQCGPIVFRDDAKMQAKERLFAHILSPRFTNYQIPIEWDSKNTQIQDIFTDLALSGDRNNQIIKDIYFALQQGRNIIVLTDRKDHVELLVKGIKPSFPDVIELTGSGTIKQKREKLDSIKNYPTDKPMLIIATGKYVGEGFDAPRLDTLLLAMPLSWKGTLAQYAGRLHRTYSGKSDVQIYDYVDIHIPVLDRMYGKRLKGYKDLGYQIGEPGLAPARHNFIFDQSNFWNPFMNDILNAKEMIWISSTSLSLKLIRLMEKTLDERSVVSSDQLLFANQLDSDNQSSKSSIVQTAFGILERHSFRVVLAEKLSCNSVIIDQRILWYGSLPPLGFHNESDSIMRIESPKLARDMQSVLVKDTIVD